MFLYLFFLFLSLTTGCILDSVVSEVNPSTVLELGTYCGYSTVRIASLLPPHAKLITLEFNPDFAVIARQVIAWAGLQDKVKSSVFTSVETEMNERRRQVSVFPLFFQVQLVEGASGDWIPKIKEQFGIKSFDLVFLDHWKDRYLPDTKLMEASWLCSFYMYHTLDFSTLTLNVFSIYQECGLLRKGSVLLADNVICPGTPDYLEYVRNSPRYKSQYFKSHLEYTKAEDGLEKSIFLG